MICIGLDPSLTCSGIVVLKAMEKVDIPEVLYADKFKTDPDTMMVQRQSDILTHVLHVMELHKVERVVLEGYGLSFGHASSVVPLVELGGLLRYFLSSNGHGYFDPRPTAVKQFATGHGKATKAQIKAAVKKRWQFVTKSPDIADAYAIATMGLAHAGLISGLTITDREVLSSMSYTEPCG